MSLPGGVGCKVSGKNCLSVDHPRFRNTRADMGLNSAKKAQMFDPERAPVPGDRNKHGTRTELRPRSSRPLPKLLGRGDLQKSGREVPLTSPTKQQKHRSFEGCTHPLTSFAPSKDWDCDLF